MDEKEAPFSVELQLDSLGDVIVGVSHEQFSPYVVIAMLEMANQGAILNTTCSLPISAQISIASWSE